MNLQPLEGTKISDFTSYADIRGALGVSDEEIKDDEIETDSNRTVLADYYDTLNSGILPAIEALPEDEDDRTPEQVKFGRLARLFATYAMANHLLNSVEMFSFVKVADGRASAERVQAAFDRLRANVQGMLARVQIKLLAALLALEPTTTLADPQPLGFATAVGIAADPVTNA